MIVCLSSSLYSGGLESNLLRIIYVITSYVVMRSSIISLLPSFQLCIL